ncbi:type 1 glutamine amidotransferase [Lachnoclostridium sp. Marseille-P6806]|uniref:type 1 glutamine amidotransferase n=1 Tax=Lachnoclostridium sp. Marseille-P6806 TaxID=2364793 RepID=UPI00102FFEA2|nr:glutamine amidotransferase [Lachnoclostridium sp. Marseille-P6806]
MELRLCHLYPEVLNLYGDRGNILCMEERLRRRGIGVTTTPLRIGERTALDRFDLFFIGGGQDFEQEVLLADLASGKGQEIRAAVEDGKTFLAICGGYQMMGHYYETREGVRCDFLGAVNFHTVGADRRMIDNYAFRLSEESGGSVVVGFENHSGRTYLGEGVRPLGTVLKGCGNNGEDGTEGCRSRNVFGTYSHGPVLPKNPELCDAILSSALERKYGRAELEPLDDRFERLAHDSVLAKIMNGDI